MQREENAAGACNTSEFKTNEIQMLNSDQNEVSAAPFTMALTEKKNLTARNASNLLTHRTGATALGSAGKKPQHL